MNSIDIVNVVSRWLHVSTAIVLVGGTVFIRFVLTPNAEQLPQAEHDRLRELVTANWRKFVRGGILLFLLTGFYNYLVVAVPQHHGDKTYHMLMGVKILAAFGVFFLAEALVGRAAVFAGVATEPEGLARCSYCCGVCHRGHLKPAARAWCPWLTDASPTIRQNPSARTSFSEINRAFGHVLIIRHASSTDL